MVGIQPCLDPVVARRSGGERAGVGKRLDVHPPRHAGFQEIDLHCAEPGAVPAQRDRSGRLNAGHGLHDHDQSAGAGFGDAGGQAHGRQLRAGRSRGHRIGRGRCTRWRLHRRACAGSGDMPARLLRSGPGLRVSCLPLYALREYFTAFALGDRASESGRSCACTSRRTAWPWRWLHPPLRPSRRRSAGRSLRDPSRGIVRHGGVHGPRGRGSWCSLRP